MGGERERDEVCAICVELGVLMGELVGRRMMRITDEENKERIEEMENEE